MPKLKTMKITIKSIGKPKGDIYAPPFPLSISNPPSAEEIKKVINEYLVDNGDEELTKVIDFKIKRRRKLLAVKINGIWKKYDLRKKDFIERRKTQEFLIWLQ